MTWPLPRGICTPPIAGACMLSNSWRRCFFDLRPRDGRPPGRPNAPAVPLRPRPPGPGRAGAMPGRAPPPPPPGRRAGRRVRRRDRPGRRAECRRDHRRRARRGRRRAAGTARPWPKPRPPPGRGGMLLGLGRGPAGRGPPGRAKSPGVPAPAAGRRDADRQDAVRRARPAPQSARCPAPARPEPDRGAAPMPVAVELNGLLPGRGPGRGACRWPGADGRGPAAAAGRSAGPGQCCRGRAIQRLRRRYLRSSALLLRERHRDRRGLTGPGRRGRARPPAARSGSRAAGAAGAVAGVAARAGGALPLPFALAAAVLRHALAACGFADCCAAKASFSLRTTGASIVEDAERTNSPISLSLAITALLSTPNSLASSYTRTFATTLPLLGPAIRALSRPGQRVLRPASACAVHRRMLIGRSSQISAFFRSHQPAASPELPFRSLC